ncbi:hypothetical protein GF402_04740 [Candidatus Fermentibacteria bacterium]|nr:hypothetical protein [Candidatus Fermentibacteria bacterium]
MPYIWGIPNPAKDYIVAAFFAVATVPFFIFLHMLGTKLFLRMQESGRVGPVLFFGSMLAVGAGGTVVACLIPYTGTALVVGLAAGVALWTALGDVSEKLGWISTLSRRAILLFLPSLAGWLVICFFVSGLPVGLKGALGYPVVVWGIHLTRVRVLSKWGPSSLAATILALANAVLGGAALAIGIIGKTPISGIIGGVLFAIAAWSTLEIIWERGMARRPWSSLSKTTDQ